MAVGERILEIDYSELDAAVKNAQKLSNELTEYAEALSSKVQSKIAAVRGGSSSHLSNADYYINAKIKDLNKKSQSAVSISTKITNIVIEAQLQDKQVAKKISAARDVLFGKHNDLVPSASKQAWLSFLENIKNLPVLGWLVKAGEQAVMWAKELKHTVHEWWHYGGGKEVFDIALKVGAAILAVAGVVVSILSGAAFVVIAAGIVLALIAIADAACNWVQEAQALKLKETGKYTVAAVHSGRDSAAQVLREHEFKEKWMNRASYGFATAIELTEVAASIVVLVAGIGESVGKFLDNKKVGFAFKELTRDSTGRITGTKYTLKSVWRGTKALLTNQKLTASTSEGLWTTLRTNAGWTKQGFLNAPKLFFKNAAEIAKHPIKYYKQVHLSPENKAETAEMIADIIKDVNSGISNSGKIIEAVANGDKPSWADVLVSVGGSAVKNIYFSGNTNPYVYDEANKKYVHTKDHFFDASVFADVIGSTGIAGLEEKLDNIGVLGKATGMDDEGFIQQVQQTVDSFKSGLTPPHEPVKVPGTGLNDAISQRFHEEAEAKDLRERLDSRAASNTAELPKISKSVIQRTHGWKVTPLAFEYAYPYLAAAH